MAILPAFSGLAGTPAEVEPGSCHSGRFCYLPPFRGPEPVTRNVPLRISTKMNAHSSAGRHIKLHSHPTGRKSVAPIRWGAASAAQRGPVVGTLTPAAQRDRGALRLLFALSRPCRGSGNTRSGPCPGPHQYRSGHPHRPAPEVERFVGHRLARPLWPPGERSVRRRARRGLGHPPDHRGHQGTGEHTRVPRCNRGGQAAARRCRPHRERRRAGDEGGDRAGMVSAGDRRTVRYCGE